MLHRAAGHDLRPVRPGLDVTVLAGQVAEPPDVDLEDVEPIEGLTDPRVGQLAAEGGNAGQRIVPARAQSEGHSSSLPTMFFIWSPCTRLAPPRMAQATWTASVICASLTPFSRQLFV